MRRFKAKPAAALDLSVAVAKLFGYRANLLIPNVSYGMGLHEMDVLMVRRSGYGAEFEIKISKWDLKRDKTKEHDHTSELTKEFYYVVTPDLYGTALKQRKDAGIILCRKQADGSYKAEIVKKPEHYKLARKWTVEEVAQVTRLLSMRVWTLSEELASVKRRLSKYEKVRGYK